MMAAGDQAGGCVPLELMVADESVGEAVLLCDRQTDKQNGFGRTFEHVNVGVAFDLPSLGVRCCKQENASRRSVLRPGGSSVNGKHKDLHLTF